VFLRAEAFFSIYTQVRTCWVRGEPGTGKSLISVALMEELYRLGAIKGVVSNIGTSLPLPPWRQMRDPDRPEEGYNLAYDVGFIGDEFWLVADSRDSQTNSRIYAALPRKFNNYWAFPSAIPIDVRLRYLSVERGARILIPGVRAVMSFLRRIPGVRRLLGPLGYFSEEIWEYIYRFDMGYKVREGKFYLAFPSHYYGLYDTSAVPRSDAGISKLLQRTYEQHTRLAPDEGRWEYDEDEQHQETTENQETYPDIGLGGSRLRGRAFGLYSQEDQSGGDANTFLAS
jgi:hypothetical protein